jgi:hypothetical protein
MSTTVIERATERSVVIRPPATPHVPARLVPASD